MLNLTCIPRFYMGAGSDLHGYDLYTRANGSILAGAMCIPRGTICTPSCMISARYPRRNLSVIFLHPGVNYLPARINYYRIRMLGNYYRASECSPCGQIFTPRAHIFYHGHDWPWANSEMVTNNLTAVIEVKIHKIQVETDTQIQLIHCSYLVDEFLVSRESEADTFNNLCVESFSWRQFHSEVLQESSREQVQLHASQGLSGALTTT